MGRSPGRPSVPFEGEIDELFIADRALAPKEIKQLLKYNRPMAAQ